MKRLLQVVSAVLAALALLLVWRIVGVWKVEPPEFGQPTQVALTEPLPPAPKLPGPSDAAVDQIVKGNLFETERGTVEDGANAASEQPLPPPTNVVLNGVFFQTTGRPMAIMTDTSAGGHQLTLKQGENVGEYQVGSITGRNVTLLGRGGQEFSLELNVGKGQEGGAATPGSVPARAVATPPAAASAAQTAAQRAAAARRQAQAQVQQQQQGQQRGAHGAQNRTEAPVAENDPGQARLEALKRLREAASRQ